VPRTRGCEVTGTVCLETVRQSEVPAEPLSSSLSATTCVPELQTPPDPPGVGEVTSLDPPGVGGERQRLDLPQSEGDERYLQLALVDGPGHNPVHQAPQELVADPEVAKQLTNLQDGVLDPEVGGDGRPQRQNVVRSQSPTQHVINGVGSPPVVEHVVHDHVTPSSLDKEVPTIIHAPAKVVADLQRRAPLERDARAGEKPTKQKIVVKPSTKVAVRSKTQRKKVTFDLAEQPPTRTLRSNTKNPTSVETHVTKKHKPTPKPVGVPIPVLKPVGVLKPNVKPVGVSTPIVRTVGTPLTTAPVIKPIIRTIGTLVPRKPSTPLKYVLPSANVKGILRHGVGFLATSCGIELPRGFTFVTPTAFSVTAPYDPPDLGKYDIKQLDKLDLVNGLMRHFDVEDKLSGPIPVMGDPTQVNLPKTVKQAMASPFAKEWAEATVEEWLSLVGNNTWTLVEKKPFMKVIPCKWVYTVKTDGNGKLDRFKARLVVGGHRQIEGVDYNKTYAHVTKHATVRTLLSVVANRSWDVQQLDIKTAFLHVIVDTDVFMLQPPGFVDGVQNVVRVDKTSGRSPGRDTYDKFSGVAQCECK
jgi:hypothetical protein